MQKDAGEIHFERGGNFFIHPQERRKSKTKTNFLMPCSNLIFRPYRKGKKVAWFSYGRQSTNLLMILFPAEKDRIWQLWRWKKSFFSLKEGGFCSSGLCKFFWPEKSLGFFLQKRTKWLTSRVKWCGKSQLLKPFSKFSTSFLWQLEQCKSFYFSTHTFTSA